jgi:hypothetical protein
VLAVLARAFVGLIEGAIRSAARAVRAGKQLVVVVVGAAAAAV